MKLHAFHVEASREYEQAAQYYANIAPALGARFHGEIERLILQVRRHPERYLRFSPPALRALSREFPYSVVYLDQPDQVWIIAVMHFQAAAWLLARAAFQIRPAQADTVKSKENRGSFSL